MLKWSCDGRSWRVGKCGGGIPKDDLIQSKINGIYLPARHNPKNRYRYVLYTLVNTLSNRKLVLELGMGKCPWRYRNPALRRIWRLRIIQISFIKIFVIVQRAKLWFPYERCSISNDLLITLFGFRQLLSWTFTGTPKTARSLLMVWPVSVWLCTTVAFYLKSWTNTL